MAQVTYEDALNTLTNMFPHMEKDVVGTLLQLNKGHMENTVDMLLQMEAESGQSTQQAESVSQAPAVQQSQSPANAFDWSTYTGPKPNGFPPFGSVADISSNFLRLPGSSGMTSSSAGGHHVTSSAERAQIEEDEKLARMLQDELFLLELRNHPELAEMANIFPEGRRGHGAAGAGANRGRYRERPQERQQQQHGAPVSSRGNIQGEVTETDDMMETFKRNMKGLGDAAKRKFDLIAARFGHRDSGSVGVGAQYTSLPGDEDEDDVIAFENSAVVAGDIPLRQRGRNDGGRSHRHDGHDVLGELGEFDEDEDELALSDPRRQQRKDD